MNWHLLTYSLPQYCVSICSSFQSDTRSYDLPDKRPSFLADVEHIVPSKLVNSTLTDMNLLCPNSKVGINLQTMFFLKQTDSRGRECALSLCPAGFNRRRTDVLSGQQRELGALNRNLAQLQTQLLDYTQLVSEHNQIQGWSNQNRQQVGS
jgi:hypothetical protein